MIIYFLGFQDAYRYKNDNKQEYTFWDYFANSWKKNHGMRIDHFLISNNLLIEKIYLLSKKNGCNLVNWQASNPPDGTIARYKKDWNAKEMDFVLYNKKWNNDLKTKYLLDNLSDFFVFPYEFLNE